MRIGHLAMSLLLVACTGAAQAQPAAPASKESSPPATSKGDCRGSADEIRACGEAWLKDCVKDWDSATHMSKQDYARTCRRVVENRVKALIEQNRTQNTAKGKSVHQ
jgi:hypothetical protein